MKTIIENTKKSTYCIPQIKSIQLDNEISLQLESDPPVFPGESISKAHEYFNNEPFNANT